LAGTFKNVLDAAVPLSAFSPAISAENAPGFFVLFLKMIFPAKIQIKAQPFFIEWMQCGRNRFVSQKRFKFNLQL
jgi:hypothetical protein